MLQLRGYSWVTGLGKLNGTELEICMRRVKVNAAGLGFSITLLRRIDDIYAALASRKQCKASTKSQIN